MRDNRSVMTIRAEGRSAPAGRMHTGSATRVPWLLFSLAVVLASTAMFLVMRNRTAGNIAENAAFVLVFMTMGLVGALVATRRPRNAVGWLFLALSGLAALSFLAGEYARYALVTRPGSLPGAVWAAWAADWMWVLAFFSPLVFVLLLFPNGQLVSPAWRWVGWAAVGLTVVAILSFALKPGPYEDVPIDNPLGIEGAAGLAKWIDTVGFVLFVALIVAAATSVIVRFRRAKGEERQQLKWFAYAAGLMAAMFVVQAVFESTQFGISWVSTVIAVLAFMAIPVSAGIAILRYRLYDIDVVIKKTVVFGAVALFITAVYVAVVVGVGTVLAGSRSSGLVTFAAAAIMAVAFQPVRERARHLGNRLVYGKRATPYEVLSQFSDRVAGVYSTEDVLPRMAKILGEGTGAALSQVWLRVGSELRPAAVWPSAQKELPPPLRLSSEEHPQMPGVTRAVPVRHQGELLGSLAVVMPPSEPLTPAHEKLLSDLASQAGLVLRNVRLTEELRAKLEELKASRQRIVTAQDEERRRLERNIHDGAQQQLVALAVKIGLAKQLAGKESPAGELLNQLQGEVAEALNNLRDLARGIYPPLLADQGLVAALSAQARKAPVPVEVSSDGTRRYPQEVEAAVYFCCLEAVQNVSKYAGASHVTITLQTQGPDLAFSVTDDGSGFNPATTRKGSGLTNMADRLAALGGTIDIASRPGGGTTVTGRLPVPELEPVREPEPVG